jgi:hypothetical protein
MRRVRALLSHGTPRHGRGVEPAKRLSYTGQNPCGPLAGNRDRDRRPCEGTSDTSAARPVANA